MRSTWPALAIMVTIGAGLAVLAVTSNTAFAVVGYAVYAAVAVGFVVRLVLAVLGRRSGRHAVEPAVDAATTWQNLYLGRKELGPIQYGDDEPVVPTLTTDTRNPFEQRLDDGNRR